MKKVIRSSYGDVQLAKFILVPMDMLEEYPDDYRADLGGYFYLWNYKYNVLTRYTDDRDFSHADTIDNLPAPIRKQAREFNIWGKTDWYKDNRRFIIVNGEKLKVSQINKIRRECGLV